MATPQQTSYIAGLAVRKTKEFKEVKELLVAHNIVGAGSETVKNAATISDICNALTPAQASQLIDALVNAKEPTRSKAYAQNRINKTITILDAIKTTVTEWSFKV